MASLSELFNRYLDEANGAYLSGGEVCSVAVSHDQRAVLCKVRFEGIVPRRTLMQMENGIRDTYGLARVRISPQYANDPRQAAERSGSGSSQRNARQRRTDRVPARGKRSGSPATALWTNALSRPMNAPEKSFIVARIACDAR